MYSVYTSKGREVAILMSEAKAKQWAYRYATRKGCGVVVKDANGNLVFEIPA